MIENAINHWYSRSKFFLPQFCTKGGMCISSIARNLNPVSMLTLLPMISAFEDCHDNHPVWTQRAPSYTGPPYDESQPSVYGDRLWFLGKYLAFKTSVYYDQITDRSARSFALLTSSSHKLRAFEDRQMKVKRGLPPFFKVNNPGLPNKKNL